MQRSLALTAIALAIAILAAHWSIVLGDDTWADVRYHTEIAPPRLAAGTQLERGELPAWWDGASFGVPLLGEPAHGALTPTTWPAHTSHDLDALLVLHLWWAALGVAAWARRRGASELGGLGAGLLVAVSGVFASAAIRGALPALAMLPWLATAAAALGDAKDRAGRAWGALGIAAALGAIALAGELAVVADGVVLAVAIAAGRAGVLRWLAAAVLAGLAIGGAQWIPAALALPHEAGATVGGLPLARLVELVAPGHFHDPAAWFPSVFVGAALFALVRIGWRDAAALAVFAGFAMVAGRGGAWPAWAGAPELHIGAAVIAIAACASGGLDGALAGDRRAAQALLGGAVVTACAAIAAAYAHPDSEAARDGAVAVGCYAIASALAWRARGTWAAPVLLALVVAPSICALMDTAPTTDRAPIEAPVAWASAALAENADRSGAPLRVVRPDPFELAVEGTVTRELGLADSAATLAGESAAIWGLAEAHTHDPARSRLDDQVWSAQTHEGGAWIDQFGVRIAVLPSSMIEARKFTPIGVPVGAYSLIQMPVLPLANVAHGWRWSVAPADALSLMFPAGGGRVIPRGTIVLRGAGSSSESVALPTPCELDSWSDGEIATRCDAGSAAGYAAISSSAARGWTARVDGEPRDWLAADVIRRAVALPPGKHHVTWSYAAPGLPAGGAVTGAGLLALLALGWAARRGKVAP